MDHFIGSAGPFGGRTFTRSSLLDAARTWYRSPAYQNASRHWHVGADYAAAIVEGVKPPAAATKISE
jgi:hypothetical protein